MIDIAWCIIQRYGTEILRDYENKTLKFQQRSARPLISRFSFVRSVSRDVYDQQQLKDSLKDGGTPIVVIDGDEISESFKLATVKARSGLYDSDVSN